MAKTLHVLAVAGLLAAGAQTALADAEGNSAEGPFMVNGVYTGVSPDFALTEGIASGTVVATPAPATGPRLFDLLLRPFAGGGGTPVAQPADGAASITLAVTAR